MPAALHGHQEHEAGCTRAVGRACDAPRTSLPRRQACASACCTTPTRTSYARRTLASLSTMRLAPHSSRIQPCLLAHGAFSTALRVASACGSHAVHSVAPAASHSSALAPRLRHPIHTPQRRALDHLSPRRAAAARCLRSHASLQHKSLGAVVPTPPTSPPGTLRGKNQPRNAA